MNSIGVDIGGTFTDLVGYRDGTLNISKTLTTPANPTLGVATALELAERGIDTRAYYSPACHRMEAFKEHQQLHEALPVTDRLASTSLSLPMGGHVTPAVASSVATELLGARPARSGRR